MPGSGSNTSEGTRTNRDPTVSAQEVTDKSSQERQSSAPQHTRVSSGKVLGICSLRQHHVAYKVLERPKALSGEVELLHKRKELRQWEHMQLSTFCTTTTLRTINSFAPRGEYTWMEKIMSMSIYGQKDTKIAHSEANAVLDKLDQYFKPTIRPGELDQADRQDERHRR